jgi:hypothetical protein
MRARAFPFAEKRNFQPVIKPMKSGLLSLLLPFLIVCSTMRSVAEDDAAFTERVSEVLKEARKVKPGMTREDLLKVFTTQGGIFSPQQRTFVYQRCSLIKVDVEFATTAKNAKVEELPSDKILKISKPYLDWNVVD